MENDSTDLTRKTIEDFGEQWTHYVGNDGFYGSAELLQDACGPLLDLTQLRGTRVADVGSGTGRIVRMLLSAGASHVYAVEPSHAIVALRNNIRDVADRVTVIQATGDQIPSDLQVDYVFSVGVLHHIPDPAPVAAAMQKALAPGGKAMVWLYGKEGNAAYLSLVRPIRLITTRLPHSWCVAITRILDVPLAGYIQLCRVLPLPLRGYLRRVLAHFTPENRRLVIYDQLNPAYAKYYTRQEALDLLERAGFKNVQAYHRHGYSWTVVGEK